MHLVERGMRLREMTSGMRGTKISRPSGTGVEVVVVVVVMLA